MSVMERSYAKQFIKSKYRLLLIVIIVQMLIMLNLFNPISMITQSLIGASISYDSVQRLDMLFTCICCMSFFTPLYQYRYLMKRSSSDLYLSLPIKRADFFHIQFMIGAAIIVGTTLLSLFASHLLSFSIMPLIYSCIKIILLEVLGITLYAFFSWIIVKCNTLLDGIMICGAYTALPLLIIMAMYIAIGRIGNDILVSNSFVSSEIIDTNMTFLFTSFVSTPFAMLCLFIEDRGSLGFNTYTMIVTIAYWVMIGVWMYSLGKKAYTMRKGEQSGERTTIWMSYPIAIPIFTFCLLMISGITKDTIVAITFIFVIYLVMYFIAKRKLRVNAFMLIQFMCLLLTVFTIERILITNHMFGSVKETYEDENIGNQDLTIMYRYSTYDNENNQTSSEMKRYSSKDWKFLDEKGKQALNAFHKDVVAYCVEHSEQAGYNNSYRYYDEINEVNLYFKVYDHTYDNIWRSYRIEGEELSELDEKITTLLKDGILEEEIDDAETE